MDKDFVWKLDFVAYGILKTVQTHYRAALVLDPTEYDEKLNRQVMFSKSPQTRLGGLAEIGGQMESLHKEYEEASDDFGKVDFCAALLKVENKPLNQQAFQLCVSTSSAIAISEMGTKLEKAAIVLYPVSEGDCKRGWDDFSLSY